MMRRTVLHPGLFVVLALALICGCNDENEKSPPPPDTGLAQGASADGSTPDSGHPGDDEPAGADEEDPNWPLFRRTRDMRGVAKTSLGDVGRIKKIWSFETSGRVGGTAAVVDQVVYIGSSDANLYALDFKTGQKKWNYKVEFDIESPVLAVDGKVYVTSLDGYVYCLDAAKGELLWKFETYGDIPGGANYFRDPEKGLRIVVGSEDNSLYCLDGIEGTKIWEYQSSNYVNATPTVWKNYAMFGGCDAYLHMVNVKTGRADATVDTSGYVAKAGAAYKDRLYVGNYTGQMLCIDLKQARNLWTFDSGRDEPLFTAPAVDDGKAVIGGRTGRLYCIDITGEKPKTLWTFRAKYEINSSPVICDGKVIFGSDDGRIYIVNLADGKELWSYDTGDPVVSSPVVVGGRIIIGSDDGNVYAFGVE